MTKNDREYIIIQRIWLCIILGAHQTVYVCLLFLYLMMGLNQASEKLRVLAGVEDAADLAAACPISKVTLIGYNGACCPCTQFQML